MDELTERLIANVGIDKATAVLAIGAILDFLRSEGPADKVQAIIDQLPGAEAAIASAQASGGGIASLVGGGVMGVSIAFHLAEAGATDVVVVERGALGSGSSGKPIGGVRAQFSDPLNIELGSRSLRAYQDFPNRPGTDIRLDTVGYLFLLSTAEQAADFESSVRMQNNSTWRGHP